MRNPISRVSLSKTGKLRVSIVILIVLIGICIFSYYSYYTISQSFLKQKYESYFLNLKMEIVSEITQAMEQEDNVNINRIIEPYLEGDVDLMVVYRNDGEIIQIFTKKGITRENLDKLNAIYLSNQEAIVDLYFWESNDPQNIFETPQESEDNRGIYDLSLLMLTTINLKSTEAPYQYLLSFNLDDYREQKATLQNTINRNSFLGGVALLGIVGVFFMINEIKRHSRGAKKSRGKKEGKKKLENPSPIKHEEEKEVGIGETRKKTRIHDTVQGVERAEFFNKQNLISENTSPMETETPNSNEKLIYELYSQITSTLEDGEYKEVIDFSSEISSSHKGVYRPFSELIGQKENWEQRRGGSTRLKRLLWVWLFAPEMLKMSPSKNNGEDLVEQDCLVQLISYSLEVIGLPNISSLEEKIVEYPLPAILLYFRPDKRNSGESGRPVLVSTFPDHLHTPIPFVATVPWLGKEKRLFKKGLPYIERKSKATAITVTRIIKGEPHIIKTVYTSQDYDSILYEQKLEILYLMKVILDCLANFSEFYRQLRHLESVDKKAEYFFEFIFKMDPAQINLLIGNMQSPTLHSSVWTFEAETYPKDAKVSFREMMGILSRHLDREFREQRILFLSDESRLLSIGCPLGERIEKNEEIPISDKIKLAIERILIQEGGMGAIQLNWKESPLLIPESKWGKFKSTPSSV